MKLSVIYFIILVSFTTTTILIAQTSRTPPISPQQQYAADVVNAIQDQRLGTLERQEAATSARVDSLVTSVDSLTGTINRFTGIGIGIGVTLTVLQALQLVVQVRRRTNGTDVEVR